jgi:outer membrane immunogenic protein
MRTKYRQLGKAAGFLRWRESANLIAMARQLILSLALVAAAGPVSAADLPSKTTPPVFAPPPSAPEFAWTGFYLGVSAGYGLDHFAFPYNVIFPEAPLSGSLDGRSGITSRGPLGGVQAGFNYQFPIPIVAGIEIDNSWSGMRGQTTVNGALPAAFGSATFGSKFEDFGTARMRIGYAIGRFLPYFTGGFTYGTVNTYYNAATMAPFFTAGSSTAPRSGLLPHAGVIGAGVEYAITDNLTVKAEYLYDFINARYAIFDSSGGSVEFGTRTMYHIARVGLNYKFDWFSPPARVVVKY